MMLHKTLCVLVISLFASGVIAQNLAHNTWVELSADYDINKKIEAGIKYQNRYDWIYKKIAVQLTELSLSYELNEAITIATTYRASFNLPGFSNRLSFSADYREGFKKIDLIYRTKYQIDWNNYEPRDVAWRNKITLEYELWKDLHPYISFEIFYVIYYTENAFNNYRSEIGIDYEVNKKNDLAFYFMIDQEFNVAKPVSLLVSGINYKYKF